MSTNHDPLRQARELSAAMLDAAEAGRWAEVTGLHADCAHLFQDAASWSDAERQSLTVLQVQYRKVQDLANSARAEVAAKLSRHRQAYRALITYLHSADSA